MSFPKPHRRTNRVIESLEPRLVFAAFTVNTLLDNTTADNVLSLREAALVIENSGDTTAALGRSLTAGESAQLDNGSGYETNTVTFDSALANGTITLESTILLTANVTLDGGKSHLRISGDATSGTVRGFYLTGSQNFTVNNLTLQDFGHTGASATPFAGAGEGGAIVGYSAHVTINNCTFTGNFARGGDAIEARGGYGNGGAICLYGGTLSINQSTFTNNVAYGGIGPVVAGEANGGAIRIDFGELNISNSTFNNNSAIGGAGGGGRGSGGAIQTNQSTLNITNSTFTQNVATANGFPSGWGGAVHTESTNGTLDFVTISDNEASSMARGIYFSGIGTLLLTNSILGQATNNGKSDLATNEMGTLSGSNNLIRETNVAGMGIISTADPMLSALAYNGGPTQTMALQADSPAIDAGGATTLTTDQRGYSRVAGVNADLGAFEVLVADPAVTSTGSGDSLTVTNADGTERFAIDNPFPQNPAPRRVASGDVTGDGTDDIIVASGPGRRGSVIAFDGNDGTQLTRFRPFEAWTGAIFVASGDVDRDGVADIIVGTGSTKWSKGRVRVFSGADFTLMSEFDAFNVASSVRVAAADLDGDGYAEVIATRGPGGGAKVRVFDGQSIATGTATIASEFIAYDRFTGGCFLATGDVNNDGQTDILVSQATGDQPSITAFNGTDNTLLKRFHVAAFNGTPIASRDMNADGYDDILAVTKAGNANAVQVFSGADDSILDTLDLDIRGRLFIA